MGWREDIRPPSFKGVEFHIESSTFGTGRKATLHELPDREKPVTEDLGKMAETFSFKAYILGEDYFKDRDKIIEALTSEGPGELIHPYYGSKYVQAQGVTIDETVNAGGYVTLSLSFTEAGDPLFPEGINDKQHQLDQAGLAAKEAIGNDFEENFSVEKMPGHVVDSLRGAVEWTSEAFESATQIVADISDAAAELSYSIREIVYETNQLMQAPGKLKERLMGSIAMLTAVLNREEDKGKGLETLFRQGRDQYLKKDKDQAAPEDEVLPSDTPTREQQQKSTTALNNLVRRTAITEACMVAGRTGFNSLEAAKAKQEQLAGLLEEHIQATDNDEIFRTLTDLKVALVQAVPADGIAEMMSYETVETEPILTIIYDKYEKMDLESDVLLRNGVSHPGFIPPKTELELMNE